MLAVLLSFSSCPCIASVVTVPDAFPTVQAAIDAGADTVLIRAGRYLETPRTDRGIALRGIGAQRPQLMGLTISNAFGESARKWRISDIEFEGTVDIITTNEFARGIQIAFSTCALRSGLRHVLRSDPFDIDLLSLTHCTLRGSSGVVAGTVLMLSDTVEAGVKWEVSDTLTVRDCRFTGGVGTALDIVGDNLDGSIASNVIEDYSTGILLYDAHGVTVTANTMRNIAGDALHIQSSRAVTVSGNVIMDCGYGVRGSSDRVTIAENVVLRCMLGGFSFFLPDYLDAARNVVGLCGASAFVVSAGNEAVITFMGNTLFGNGGAGIEILSGTSGSILVTNNIVASNVGWGLQIPVNEFVATVGCNAWFANGLGSVTGAQADSSDFEVDPGFCDISTQDVSLFSDSPLSTQTSCGQIGARGVGCRPPALSAFAVASNRAGLGVTWEFEASAIVQSWIERADHSGGPWDSLGTGTAGANSNFEFLDTAVAPDRGYYYRVVWRDRGSVIHGATAFAMWNDAGRLSSVMPNPAVGEVTVDWVLARPGPADIRVFDLAGREVSIVSRGTFDVGRHQARWDGRWDGRGIAPAGMYIVRITSAERTTNHRVLLLR